MSEAERHSPFMPSWHVQGKLYYDKRPHILSERKPITRRVTLPFAPPTAVVGHVHLPT